MLTSRTKHARPQRQRPGRQGAVAVEFAFVAPLLMAILLGLVEMTRVYDMQNLLETAAREGARFAAMDRGGLLQDGETANEKVIGDVKTFLESASLDPDQIQVRIRDAADPDLDFDLEDPANDLRLFRVEIDVPYSAVSHTPVGEEHDYTLSAFLVFRNGRATLSE